MTVTGARSVDHDDQTSSFQQTNSAATSAVYQQNVASAYRIRGYKDADSPYNSCK